ncbi:hypothetical protein C8R47DRAFT_1145915 [Mycena vitilis]|nr:hypothetical protein C8R47DRAFT_1145915 [Mycena vitilis]
MDSAGRKPSPNFKTSLMELQRNLKEIEHSWKADVLGWWGAKISYVLCCSSSPTCRRLSNCSLPAKLKSLTCRVSFRAALLRTPRFQIKWGCQSFRYECTMHCVRTSIAPFRLLTSEETRGPGSGPRYYRAPSGMDTLFQARSLYGGLIVRDGPREASLSKSEFSCTSLTPFFRTRSTSLWRAFCLRTSLSSASLEPRPRAGPSSSRTGSSLQRSPRPSRSTIVIIVSFLHPALRSRPALFKLERLPPSTKFAHHCPSSPQWI